MKLIIGHKGIPLLFKRLPWDSPSNPLTLAGGCAISKQSGLEQSD
jgi:hypothetical protein